MGTLPIRGRTARWCRDFALLVIALGTLAADADPGPGDLRWQHCSDSIVVVGAADRKDADDACQGARRAIAFFRTLGLRTDDPIAVEILNDLPDVVSERAAGAFLKSERRVLLQTYGKFKANKTWFGVPIDRRLYQGAAAHEVAHALASANFRIPMPSIEATEYIAYVTQFATMDESQRRAALAAFPGDGFDSEIQMSEVIYMLAPMRFGAEAYRHYLKPGNGPAFVHAILSGAALGD